MTKQGLGSLGVGCGGHVGRPILHLQLHMEV